MPNFSLRRAERSHPRPRPRSPEAFPSFPFALIIFKNNLKIIFGGGGGRAGPGCGARAAAGGREEKGREGKGDPGGGSAPGGRRSAPVPPGILPRRLRVRPGEAKRRLQLRPVPGGAFAPIPLGQANTSASPGEPPGAKARGTPSRRASLLRFCFCLFIWFGFPTLGDTATANNFV